MENDYARGSKLGIDRQALTDELRSLLAGEKLGHQNQSIGGGFQALLSQNARQSATLSIISCSPEMFLAIHESPHLSGTSVHKPLRLFALGTYRT